MLVRQVECAPTAGRERREYELVLPKRAPLRLWYEVPEAHAGAIRPNMDHVAVGVLMLAMHVGEPLTIDGEVSAGLVANLMRYQAIWADWIPERYRQVEIVAGQSPAATVDPAKAVALFSGGVDATWMVNASLRDGTLLPGHSTAVMVRGMGGFQPGRVAQYLDAFREAQEVTRPLGLDLVEVSTNWEQVMLPLGLPVLEIYVPGFVSCLHFVASTARRGLVASAQGPTFEERVSGTPESDRLLSSDTFEILHLGAGLSRAQKLDDLHRWGANTEYVRVCNRTMRTARNCGTCEKCVRTALASQVAAAPLPGGLPRPGPGSIRAVDVGNVVIRNEWQLLLDQLAAHSTMSADVRRAVRRRIRWFDMHLPTRHKVSRLTRRARRRVRRGLRRAVGLARHG